MQNETSIIPSDKKYLTMGEAAEYLGLSYFTLFRLVQRLEVPFVSYGKRIRRFDKARLDLWVSERSTKGKT